MSLTIRIKFLIILVFLSFLATIVLSLKKSEKDDGSDNRSFAKRAVFNTVSFPQNGRTILKRGQRRKSSSQANRKIRSIKKREISNFNLNYPQMPNFANEPSFFKISPENLHVVEKAEGFEFPPYYQKAYDNLHTPAVIATEKKYNLQSERRTNNNFGAGASSGTTKKYISHYADTPLFNLPNNFNFLTTTTTSTTTAKNEYRSQFDDPNGNFNEGESVDSFFDSQFDLDEKNNEDYGRLENFETIITDEDASNLCKNRKNVKEHQTNLLLVPLKSQLAGFPAYVKMPHWYLPGCFVWRLQNIEGNFKNSPIVLKSPKFWSPIEVSNKVGCPNIQKKSIKNWKSFPPNHCPCKWPCTQEFDSIQECYDITTNTDVNSMSNYNSTVDTSQLDPLLISQLCSMVNWGDGLKKRKNFGFQLDWVTVAISKRNDEGRSKFCPCKYPCVKFFDSVNECKGNGGGRNYDEKNPASALRCSFTSPGAEISCLVL